jgi:hypothetical protein
MDEFTREILGASDRACALLLGSLLDNTLAKTLSTKTIELTENEFRHLFLEQNSVLGTFADKIAMAYVLELISEKQRQTLTQLREIRNTFAHAIKPITFMHPLVLAECKKLPPLSPSISGKPGNFSEGRITYMAASLVLFGELSKIFQQHIETQRIFKMLADWKPKFSP